MYTHLIAMHSMVHRAGQQLMSFFFLLPANVPAHLTCANFTRLPCVRLRRTLAKLCGWASDLAAIEQEIGANFESRESGEKQAEPTI